jgi:CHRD domain
MAELSSQEELPPTDSQATGSAEFTPMGSDSVMYNVNATNIEGVTAGHIHSGQQGENGPIVVTLFKYGSPMNEVSESGSITADKLEGPMAGKQLSDLATAMRNGSTYVNIHTEQNPNGDIRGQISAASFRHYYLLQNVSHLLNSLGFPSGLFIPSETLVNEYYDPSSSHLENIEEMHSYLVCYYDESKPNMVTVQIIALPITPLEDPGNPGAHKMAPPNGLMLGPLLAGAASSTFDIGSRFKLELKGGFEHEAGIKIEIRPENIKLVVPPDLETTRINAQTRLIADLKAPLKLLGRYGGTRLEVEDFELALLAEGSTDNPEVGIEMNIKKGRLIISGAEGDNFLQKLLPQDPVVIDFDLVIGFSVKKGFYLKGGAGLEYTFQINKQFGPIIINTIHLKLDVSDKKMLLNMTATGQSQFGIMDVVLSEMGLEGVLNFDRSGLLGDKADVSFGFKPPDGLGIHIDSNGVKGGGYILRREDQYAGVIELDLRGFTVQALAILNTKPSVSFIFIIFTDLSTPIQIGGGWKITKIGGFIGFDRTVNHYQIASGIQTGTLDSILFPDNIIHDAPRIIDDINRVFPIKSQQYLIGPAVRIAYLSLITGDIAIILEFPNPFQLSILGKITSKIPEKNPIIEINLGILGAIDFVNGKVGIYGSLYNSRILSYTLSGDMAMAASWGAEKNFIFSIGGFNPRFVPPANFPPFGAPPLKRLQVSLSNAVTMESYLALTSNTFQVGAKVQARFSGAGATISGYLGFDALIQFNPLYYVVDIYAGFSVKFKKKTLASITFAGFLEGPNPHRIKGKASFSILWWDITVSVDQRFGSETPPEISVVDPWPLLESALMQNESWSTDFPEWADIGVTIKESSIDNTNNTKAMVVHPLGTLKVSQKVLPLNYTLTKFGASNTAEANRRFEIKPTSITTQQLSTIQDYFSPAQFSEYTNSEKLSLKSFDLMDSGVSFGLSSKDVDFDAYSITYKRIEYETSLENPKKSEEGLAREEEERKKIFSPNESQIQIFELTGASYSSMLNNNKKMQYRHRYQKDRFVSMSSEKFFIVDKQFNKLEVVLPNVFSGPDLEELLGKYGQEYSQAHALDKLRRFNEDMSSIREWIVFNLTSNPNLQVISAFEREVTIH